MNEHTFNVHWRGRTWIVWPDAMKIDTLEKTVAEKRTYEFEFAVQDEIRAGDTIASVSDLTAALRSGSGSLTLGTASISGSKVRFTAEGGVAGDVFDLNCLATTTAGVKLSAAGVLNVVAVT